MIRDYITLLTTGDIKSTNDAIVGQFLDMLKILFMSLFICSILSTIVFFSMFMLDFRIPINRTQLYLESSGTGYSLFFSSFLAPITEELGFRVGLKYSALNLALMFFFLFFVFTPYSSSESYYIKVSIAFILSEFIYILIKYNTKLHNKIKLFYKDHKKKMFYISIFFFSFSHAINYENIIDSVSLIPILTIPQIAIAISLSFVRLKYGIIYSIVLHSLFNTILIFIQHITL